VGKQLYKSVNSGATWTTYLIGAGLEGNTAIDVAISPNYVTDSTVIVATAMQIWRSINGGKTFGDVGSAALMAMVGTNAIITVDVANHYMGGRAIVVGVKDPDSDQFGSVFRYTTSVLAWVDLQVGNAATGKDVVGGIYDVLATKFSRKHDGDAQYITLVTNEVDTVLTT
jgi:hypothetical protein